MRKSRGLSILLVEQNFDFISDLSDRVLVLERGRITGALGRADMADQAKVDQFLGFGTARSTRAQGANGPSGTLPYKPKTNPVSGPRSEAPVQFVVSHMTIKRPTLTQMRDMAARFGMHLTDEELK